MLGKRKILKKQLFIQEKRQIKIEKIEEDEYQYQYNNPYQPIGMVSNTGRLAHLFPLAAKRRRPTLVLYNGKSTPLLSLLIITRLVGKLPDFLSFKKIDFHFPCVFNGCENTIFLVKNQKNLSTVFFSKND